MNLNCYRVTVECTNASRDCFSTKDGGDGEYYDVEDGVCYVIAKNMSDVERYFQNSPNIVKIERVGIGYPQVICNK